MPSPSFIHRPAATVAQFPALEAPAAELGLLDEPLIDGRIGLTDLPARLTTLFPCAHFQLHDPDAPPHSSADSLEDLFGEHGGRSSGIRQQGEWIEIRLPASCDHVDAVDLLREFGCMVEAVTARLLDGRRGTMMIPILGRDRPLQFDRRTTPGHLLETAGFKFPDHSRAYVNRHAAAVQSLAIALLTRTDPRFVFVDILEGASEDAQMLKLLSALAFRSNIDFRDRRELEEYANLYWRLEKSETPHLFNIHQVNEAASYYARQLRAHVRALAV